MNVGIVRFPGSNCDFDALGFFKKAGHDAEFIWYRATTLPRCDALVLPGGFAFGDRSYRKALGITNCLNFGHPKDSIGAFSETIRALTARCKKFKIPIVGGNVSLYNAHGPHSIKPTPVLVMVGVRLRSLLASFSS